MRATVVLMPPELRHQLHIPSNEYLSELVALYKRGSYTRSREIHLSSDSTAEAAAEELFDLTNNPTRQEERELLYGLSRGMSMGDIVELKDATNPEIVECWLCMNAGWVKLP